MRRIFTYILLLLSFTFSYANEQATYTPFADIHLHFNWDQAELVTPEQAVQALRDHNVVLAVVFSTPAAHALRLSNAGKAFIIPFFSPYVTVRSRHTWFRDKQVLIQARQGLVQKRYHGIGEVHVISGLGPRRDNEILQGLLRLAAEFGVPFNIHTEASDADFFKVICQEHKSVRFLWSHAGGILGPEHSQKIIDACPNVWIELSARDPWHYGGLVDEHGTLQKEWSAIFIKYPQRFMVGTDPVWKAHQVSRWDEANEGWLHYAQLNVFHRKWLAQLPEDVARKIQVENALKFFGRN